MRKFLKRLFRRIGVGCAAKEKETVPNPSTLDGIPMSMIQNGDRLEWTDDNGRKVSGYVMDINGQKTVQINAFRSVSLLSVIEKSKIS